MLLSSGDALRDALRGERATVPSDPITGLPLHLLGEGALMGVVSLWGQRGSGEGEVASVQAGAVAVCVCRLEGGSGLMSAASVCVDVEMLVRVGAVGAWLCFFSASSCPSGCCCSSASVGCVLSAE